VLNSPTCLYFSLRIDNLSQSKSIFIYSDNINLKDVHKILLEKDPPFGLTKKRIPPECSIIETVHFKHNQLSHDDYPIILVIEVDGNIFNFKFYDYEEYN